MKFSPVWLHRELAFPYSPTTAFISFALANFLISYFDLPLQAKLWIALAGFGLPLFLFFIHPMEKTGGKQPLWKIELFPNLPGWVFVLAALLAIAPRFYQLTGLSVWPFTDEGYCAFYSIILAQHWPWRFFISWSQQPAFYNWLLALFFKVISPSLFSLWLFPALFSILTVPATYFAVRPMFSKSFAFFCVLAMAFSYWPVYTGRLCAPLVALLFWEILCLALLSSYLKAGDAKRRRKWAIFLGAATGFGFFVAISWPVVALSVLAAYFSARKRPGDGMGKWFFLGPSAALFMIFLFASIRAGNGQYAKAAWGLTSGTDWAQQTADCWTYIKALFWGADWRRLYGPVWGGLLNPVLGALFVTGLLELIRAWRLPAARWMVFSFCLFLVPAFVSKGYDSFRILADLPLAVFFCVAGLQALLPSLGRVKKLLFIFLIFGVSAGLDYHHLFDRFHQLWGTPGNAWNFGKEYQLWKSCDILQRVNRESGPGALLFNLRTSVDDVTPAMAAYSFDAAWNPSIPLRDAKWMAVLVNGTYGPFLSKRFPEGHYYWLCPKEPYGRWALGVIPVLPGNREILERWFAVNQQLRPATELIIDTMPGASRQKIVDQVLQCHGAVRGDPFLASCVWEKVFDNRAIEHDAPGCLEAARRCVSEGYPLPEMFNEEGVILTQMGRYQEARKAFEKALKTDALKLTPARENIQALNTAGK